MAVSLPVILESGGGKYRYCVGVKRVKGSES